MEEKELSLQCAKGDAVARKILYERYSEHLYGICLRYSADRQGAQDLLHDSFIKIYSNIGKFTYRGKGSLKGWISKLTVNLALEYIRREIKIKKTELPQNIVEEIPPESFSDGIPVKKLIEFIEGLPPGYRAVFNLYVFEELPHKEIARRLGINERSSSSQLLRAKTAIAKKIDNYLKESENGKLER